MKPNGQKSFKNNKTGSHQCTRAVCSTFAEIHSTVAPWCIDALFGVRIPLKSLVQSQSVIQIPVRQSRVQSMFTQNAHGKLIPETFLYLSDTRNAWSFYYIWHSFGLEAFRNERLLLGPQAPSHKMQMVCFLSSVVNFRDCAVRPSYVTFEIAQYGPHTSLILYRQNGRRLPGLFV